MYYRYASHTGYLLRTARQRRSSLQHDLNNPCVILAQYVLFFPRLLIYYVIASFSRSTRLKNVVRQAPQKSHAPTPPGEIRAGLGVQRPQRGQSLGKGRGIPRGTLRLVNEATAAGPGFGKRGHRGHRGGIGL